jgi:hypothetical protein
MESQETLKGSQTVRDDISRPSNLLTESELASLKQEMQDSLAELQEELGEFPTRMPIQPRISNR